MIWVGASLASLRAFPDDARRRAGYQLRRLQVGLPPDDGKPVHTVGAGVEEIRIHLDREFRVLYVARFREAVYVLHAFEKRDQRIRRTDLDLARRRYRQVMALRANEGGPR